MRWIAGDTLAQTVFTCYYCHQPGVLKDRVLQSFVLSTLKICSLIKNVILNGEIIEVFFFFFFFPKNFFLLPSLF